MPGWRNGAAARPATRTDTMPGALAVEPFPERDHDRLRQRLGGLRSQLPSELVRLVALNAECHGRSID
jgi:hypothetical protein